MSRVTVSAEESTTPHSDVAAYLIEANYRLMGCDGWNTRRVQRLCGKLGETPTVLAARMRVRPTDLLKKMQTDTWTRQDALILTVIEREVEFMRGGIEPKGRLIEFGGGS